MSVLDKIVENRKRIVEIEKRNNMIRILKDFIDELDLDLKEKRKLKLSKEIKHAKEYKNPLITEIKPSSPSKGNIREISLKDVEKISNEMVEGGATALSVLTEPKYFKGSYKNLIVARKVNVPILMKDFIVDFYQIDIAREIGANAVLLIVSTLKDRLGEFLDYAKENDLECLVEIHSEEELDTALEAGAKIIGINNRNLKTLKIDLSTTEKLSPLIPKNKLKIGESGVYTKDQLNYILRFTDAVLIGSSIMESEDIKNKVKELSAK
ncbi:MAG: indole-3-glycerol-phosphate synthase [Methanococci archaeon]|nr:indole-3-glycerol-phosphate synthase [Methanococci archaeon]